MLHGRMSSTSSDDPTSGVAQTMEVLVTALPAESRMSRGKNGGQWELGQRFTSVLIRTNQITVGD